MRLHSQTGQWKKNLYNHSCFTPLLLNNNPQFALYPFYTPGPVRQSRSPAGYYALHTELCCKSRSILKGSVIIPFVPPLHVHTQPMHGVVWGFRSAFSIPLTSPDSVLIGTHAVRSSRLVGRGAAPRLIELSQIQARG